MASPATARPGRKASAPAASASAFVLPAGFADEIVRWQASHGRHALPWQNTRDPYRVWLSEIMLQQTQVSTVLAYYAKFLDHFPTVRELAAASPDEVMGLWSGLGYYSRARNLHRCAQDVVALHGGAFPRTAAVLQTLPGIGRSTAAAIASFCFGERVAILDGNVKRVLTRVLAFAGDLASSANERVLWDLAQDLLPRPVGTGVDNGDLDLDLDLAMPRYTQGLMDLGSGICTSRSPQCLLCPVQSLCQGLRTGEPTQFPVKTRKLKRSALAFSLLWAQREDGAVWLERRPATGIWGGLYCLPVFVGDDELTAAVPQAQRGGLAPQPQFLHVLTHKDLYLTPWRVTLPAEQAGQPDGAGRAAWQPSQDGAWFPAEAWPALGLPAPVRKLLDEGQRG